MIKIESKNVHYDKKIQHYSQIKQYVAHVVSVGAHADLQKLININNMRHIIIKLFLMMWY